MKLYERGTNIIAIIILIILVVVGIRSAGGGSSKKSNVDWESKYEYLSEENEMLREVIRNAKNYIEAEEYDDAHYVLDALDPRW